MIRWRPVALLIEDDVAAQLIPAPYYVSSRDDLSGMTQLSRCMPPALLKHSVGLVPG